MKNLISAELSSENEELAISKLDELKAIFPFLIDLTVDERRHKSKMGKKTLDFVDRALIYAREHNSLIPPFVDLAEFEKDFVLLKQLQRILSVLEPFTEQIRDTKMQLGAEAYHAARDFYNSTKRAAKSGVHGSDHIAKDLGERYKRRFEDNAKPEENKEPPAEAA